MGRSVGDMAAEAVARGSKKKSTERTPEQIIPDIRRNLDVHLSVTPGDLRFLLARYDELAQEIEALKVTLQASAPTIDQQPIYDILSGETKAIYVVPDHVGNIVEVREGTEIRFRKEATNAETQQ